MSKEFGEAAAKVITKSTKEAKTTSPSHIEVATFAAGIVVMLFFFVDRLYRVFLGSGAVVSTSPRSCKDRGSCQYSRMFTNAL